MDSPTQSPRADGGAPEQRDLYLKRQVEDLLNTSSYTSLRNVSCEVKQGEVILSGKLSSFYLKQVLQTLVQQMDEVCCLCNQVEVMDDSARSARLDAPARLNRAHSHVAALALSGQASPN